MGVQEKVGNGAWL